MGQGSLLFQNPLDIFLVTDDDKTAKKDDNHCKEPVVAWQDDSYCWK